MQITLTGTLCYWTYRGRYLYLLVQ